MSQSELRAAHVINQMHQHHPDTRMTDNRRAGRLVLRVVEEHGGEKLPFKDRYPAVPGDPYAPQSGQRYAVANRYASGDGLRELAAATAAYARHRHRR